MIGTHCGYLAALADGADGGEIDFGVGQMTVYYCNSLATAIEKMRAVRSSATLILPSPLNLPFQVGDLKLELNGEPRGSAAGDFETLASKLYCRRANRDFACRDPSDRDIAP
jgi:hypothetical protein